MLFVCCQSEVFTRAVRINQSISDLSQLEHMSRQVVGAVAAAVTTIMEMVVIDRDDTRFIGFPVNIASAASGSMPSTTAHVYVH